MQAAFPPGLSPFQIGSDLLCAVSSGCSQHPGYPSLSVFSDCFPLDALANYCPGFTPLQFLRALQRAEQAGRGTQARELRAAASNPDCVLV